jgi:acyl-CoA thioesterase I
MSPWVGVSSPANNPSSVDLPEPDTPVIATRSRAARLKLISSSMRIAPCGPMTSLPTCRAHKTWPGVSSSALLLALFIIWLGPYRAAWAGAERSLLILGDSLSAGYGIALADAWPSLLGARLAQEGYPYHVVNASISGETTAGGARRIAALLAEHKPAIVVVALGANDGLRGFQPAEVRKNLQTIIAAVRRIDAVPVLLRVRIPPNYGPQYTASFEAVYVDFSARDGVLGGPFLLEGFATDSNAFQADGLHPLASMEPRIVKTLWPVIASAMDVAQQRKEKP